MEEYRITIKKATYDLLEKNALGRKFAPDMAEFNGNFVSFPVSKEVYDRLMIEYDKTGEEMSEVVERLIVKNTPGEVMGWS